MLQKNERLVLQQLVKDCRLTDHAIAEKTGISTQSVARIRSRLEQEGIIRGYHVELDPERIGLDIVTIYTLAARQRIADEEKFRKIVTDDQNITFCERIQQGGSLFALIAAFRNLEESERYFTRLQKQHPQIIVERLQSGAWSSIWKDRKRDAYLLALEHAGKK